jgi:hypothetical protein
MADTDLKVGDIVELEGDFLADDHPWHAYAGKRGVVHWLPDPTDERHDGHEGVIVTFDDPAFPGVSTHQRDVRKVE